MEDHGFMELEQRKAFLIKFCYWGGIALCAYMAVECLLPVLFSFVAAYTLLQWDLLYHIIILDDLGLSAGEVGEQIYGAGISQ